MSVKAQACDHLLEYRAEPHPQSVKDLKVSMQQAFAGRFQEYIPQSTYIQGMSNDLIPLKNINNIPIHFLVAADDTKCPQKDAMDAYNTIPSSGIWLLYRTYNNEDFLQGGTFIDDLTIVLQ